MLILQFGERDLKISINRQPIAEYRIGILRKSHIPAQGTREHFVQSALAGGKLRNLLASL